MQDWSDRLERNAGGFLPDFCQTMSSLERVLKGYEGPDEFFLHDVNAGRTQRPGGKLDVRSLRVLRPGSEPPRGER